MALLNDGTLAFATRMDPEGYIIGSCQINYRNTGNVPAHLRVTYTAKTLTVMLDPMGDGKDYRTCIQKTGINLPSGYYFGFSVSHFEIQIPCVFYVLGDMIRKHAKNLYH